MILNDVPPQLPRRIHTAFGGAPLRKLSWRKSESLETIVKPCTAAYSQTTLSSAVSSPYSPDVSRLGIQVGEPRHEARRQVW